MTPWLCTGGLKYCTLEALVTDRVSYHDIAVGQLELMRSGALGVGDRMLGERELAEQYGASTATVRRAIRELQVMGVVEGRRGAGNYVRALPDASAVGDSVVDHLDAARQAAEKVDWDRMPPADVAALRLLFSITESLEATRD
jgi:DNA-binding GntR family transcriptional regulator